MSANKNRGHAVNLVSISFLISAVAVAYFAYQYLTPYSGIWPYIGIIAGLIIGYFAAPLLFVFLVVTIHVMMKVEDFILRRK